MNLELFNYFFFKNDYQVLQNAMQIVNCKRNVNVWIGRILMIFEASVIWTMATLISRCRLQSDPTHFGQNLIKMMVDQLTIDYYNPRHWCSAHCSIFICTALIENCLYTRQAMFSQPTSPVKLIRVLSSVETSDLSPRMYGRTDQCYCSCCFHHQRWGSEELGASSQIFILGEKFQVGKVDFLSMDKVITKEYINKKSHYCNPQAWQTSSRISGWNSNP